MYLIQACMSGKLRNVPLTLPPGLYEQAGGSRIIQPQATGPLAAAPLSPAHTGVAAFQRAFPGPAPSTILPWDVTAAEKASADGFFDTLDPQKRGYIEGDVAVPFMLQSQLPEDVLAQVWDLSDINNDGRLTKDCFAVAMHLIQGKLAGRPLPATLPPTLVPPSLRGGQLQSHISAPAPPPPASEPLRDLLWDDTPPQSAVAPQATGGAAVSLGTPTGSSGAPNNTFNPQSFTPHATGSAFQSPQPSHIPSSYGVPNQKPSQDPFGPSFSAAGQTFQIYLASQILQTNDVSFLQQLLKICWATTTTTTYYLPPLQARLSRTNQLRSETLRTSLHQPTDRSIRPKPNVRTSNLRLRLKLRSFPPCRHSYPLPVLDLKPRRSCWRRCVRDRLLRRLTSTKLARSSFAPRAS